MSRGCLCTVHKEGGTEEEAGDMIGIGRGQDRDDVPRQRWFAEQTIWKQLQRPGWEGLQESGGWQWPLQEFVGRATSWLKCKLLTHSCSKSRSSGGTVGQLAAGNLLIEKSPMGAGFTAFKLLLRYLDACGKSTDCLFSEKKK